MEAFEEMRVKREKMETVLMVTVCRELIALLTCVHLWHGCE